MVRYSLHTHTRHARGSVYLLVLSTSILVTVIGLSSLLAIRVERRSTDLTVEAAHARVAASSFLEVALLRINSDPDWRHTYQNNTWEPNEIVEDWVFTFKLVDEQDSDLANDVTQAARLYSRITGAGLSVMRMYSVQLEPKHCVNLLSNPGFEEGATGWTGSNCTLVPSGDTYRGTGSVLLQNRMTSDSMIRQGGLKGAVEDGKQYYVEVWAKSVFATEDLTVSFRADADLSGSLLFSTTPTTVGNWTQVSGFLTPTWSGTLTIARWQVSTEPVGGATDFYVDQALMIEAGDLAMVPVSGTWRREVEP